jgi:hypothetical protein
MYTPAMLRWRRHLLIIALLALILAPANYFFAKWRITTKPRMTTSLNVFGDLAAARDHPAPIPPGHPEWPRPTQYSVDEAFGFKRIGAWYAENGTTTHQMMVWQYGWPLPVYTKQGLAWPQDDPVWKSNYVSERPPVLRWTGAILNPLIAATALWAIFLLPIFLFIAIRRAHRHARGACEYCGYPRGTSPTCVECGFHHAPVRAATPSSH